MLLTVFSSFYEWICGTNAESPEYNDNGIYDSVGLITVVSVITFVVLFYLILGRWKPIFYALKHWVLTLVIAALVGFGFAFTVAKKELGSTDAYLIRFAVINAICMMLLFFIFSLVFKRASIFAKRTPF